SLDQLDDIMMMFGAMDIEVVDSAKAGRLPSEVRERKAQQEPEENDDDGPPEPIDLTPGPVGRTEDPVRLYLREMGRVALLTREGEIALAKRIEEGKNQVTVAILSTNLALERFRELRELLRGGDISIKEVVDVNEEEFTEEKEIELTRTVVNAFGAVERMLRDRDQIADKARKLKAKTGGGKTPRRKTKGKVKDPAWKKLETQAMDRNRKVLEKLRAPARDQGGRGPRQRQGRRDQARDDRHQAGPAQGGHCQEGDGRGQPPARHLDRQEVHEPRPAVPGSDPGRQHRPHESRRQIRISSRVQVLHVCDLVDSPGHHARHRGPGAHDPHSRAHDRDDQQAHPDLAPAGAGARPRAHAGRDRD